MRLRELSPDRFINVVDVLAVSPDNSFRFVTVNPGEGVCELVCFAGDVFDLEIELIKYV